MTNHSEDAEVPYEPGDDGIHGDRILRIKERHEESLLAIDGVVGVGVGPGSTGEDVVVVYLRDSAAVARLPAALEGVAVVPNVIGDIDAL